MEGKNGELGKLLIEGLEQALAYQRGELTDVRVVRYERRPDGVIERVETRGEQVTREIAEPRAKWDAAFARMAANRDDPLLDADSSASSWDDEEWEWPTEPGSESG